MSATTNLAASLIETGVAGYASAAASRMVENRPEVSEHFGNGAFRPWKEHLAVRLRELAAALSISEPDLFVADVVWSRRSFTARELSPDLLRASLEDLSAVLAEELPEGSRREPLDYLSRAFEAVDGDRADDGDVDGPAPDSVEERLALTYLEAALSGERRRAIELLLRAVDDGLSPETVYQRVLAMAQIRVGEMWHRWELSVPQEHFVTATTRTAMALLAHRFETRPANGKTVVVSVVPGNGHELAALALADFFERDGWKAIHLGGDMPAADLALGVEAFEADVLALSMALSTQVRGAIEVVRKVRAMRPATRVLIGGAVISRTPELWRKLGADGSARDFEEALRVAAELAD